MGTVKPPPPAKLLIGVLAPDRSGLDVAIDRLEREFGSIDLRSPVWNFDATRYYQDELGEHIQRQFVSVEPLIEIERLPAIKLRTNELERPGSSARRVNLDPGYLTLSKLVLATTKDYAHRLYLRDGIYAEVTLHYESGAWRAFPWTYRDYAAGAYVDFFDRVRTRLKEQLAAS